MGQGKETKNQQLSKLHDQKSVDMQDRRPGDVTCSKCGRMIVPQTKAQGMRERTIAEFVEAHKCQESMQSKRDFEQEVR